jgi:signal peptidase I
VMGRWAPRLQDPNDVVALVPGAANLLAMFTPKWKKDARLLAKGARKFVHYKRDLLKPEEVTEIESRRQDLLIAVQSGDRAKADEAGKQLRAKCEHALPREKPPTWVEENVEVMFVAIVIALGLRAYYLQPFRIPTGSMQPTLNGIVGKPLKREDWPSLPTRIAERVLRGRSYVHVVNDLDRQIAVTPDGRIGLQDVQFLHFFSRSQLHFRNDRPMRLPAPASQMTALGLADALRVAAGNGGTLPAGTVLAEGTIDAGDLVLVDKFSYHFRRPKRGEVFVFDTLGIRGIHDRQGDQAAGSHYIKRLCGVPGDTLSIDSPELLINGRPATEPTIRRVAEAEGEYAINPHGYVLAGTEQASQHRKPVGVFLSRPTDVLHLNDSTAKGLREYAALGDNTGSSLDSRYWGPVKEFNLVGPALFSLWPISTGHWGLIR